MSAEVSTLLIAGLLTWTFASGLLPSQVPQRLPVVYWSAGIVGALAFLASLLGHEIAHAVVARRNGVGVRGITLWMFGGVAQLEGDPPSPGAEFRIAAAGPAASFAMGALAIGGSVAINSIDGPQVWVVMLAYLGLLNGFLTVFNLLPGAPLDGGRILGSIMWKLRGDRSRGMHNAAVAGQVIAGLVIAGGFAEMMLTGDIGSLWTVLIGVFLFNAARAEAGYYRTTSALSNITAAQVMVSPVQVVSTWEPVATVVSGVFHNTQQGAVPVVDETQQIRGLVLLDSVKQLPAQSWRTTEVVRIMSHLSDVAMVSPTDTLREVVSSLGPTGHALVLSEGRLVGLIGPGQIRDAARNPGQVAPTRPAGAPAGSSTPY
ncbi:MAG: site-2 protease family protein [Microthrixaceae bacterium]